MIDLFVEHEGQFHDLSQRLLQELPNALKYHEISDSDLFDLAQVLADRGLITVDLLIAFLFRHYSKNDFNLESSLASLLSFFEWRLSTQVAHFDLDVLPQESLQRLQNGFCVITDGIDKKNRPLLFIKLDQVRGMALEVLRSHLQFVMEMCRRLIFYLNQEGDQEAEKRGHPLLFQISVLVDVNGVGLSHFNLEYLPCLREVFSALFPQSFGCIYVLNYGWVHAGLWSVIKQLLTAETQERLLFLDQKDLQNYISIDNIPQAYGGSLVINDALCDKFQSFLESMERNVFKHDIQEIYDQLLQFKNGVSDTEDDVWFDAREHGFNTKIKSAADLQVLLHPSPSRNISVPVSRTASNPRNLHSSSSYISFHESSNGNSSIRAGSITTPNIFSRIVYEVSMAANPGIGLARGFIVSFFDWGNSMLRRKHDDSGNTPKKRPSTSWRQITIVAIITISIIISHRFRKRLAY